MIDSFKSITLEDQKLFSSIFSATGPMASEMTFSYLYMWKRDYNLRYAVIEGYLCLISQSRVYQPFVFSPLPVDGIHHADRFKKALAAIEAYFKENNLQLCFGRVEEAGLSSLKAVYEGRMETEFLDSASDYVYNASDLITLAGKKYSGKRNHISQFIREYEHFDYVPVDRSNLSECRRILDEWCDKNEEECVHPDNCERLACYELLDHWDELPLKGALIKVGGKFEAMTIGELLNPEMAAIRIEKGNTDIHGIYTLINKEFCSHEWQNVKYINREEDMGIEGLKKSKLSYNPAFMVRKFLVKVSH